MVRFQHARPAGLRQTTGRGLAVLLGGIASDASVAVGTVGRFQHVPAGRSRLAPGDV